jgi:hypothetical protein
MVESQEDWGTVLLPLLFRPGALSKLLAVFGLNVSPSLRSQQRQGTRIWMQVVYLEVGTESEDNETERPDKACY